MRTFLRRLLAIVIMGVLVVGVAVVMTAPEPPQRGGGGGGGGGGGRRLVTPQGPVPVLVAQAAIADVPLYLEGVGTTRALNLVTVHSQVDGKLISVNFREGSAGLPARKLHVRLWNSHLSNSQMRAAMPAKR